MIPEIKYQKALEYIEQKDFKESNAILNTILNYKDSQQLIHYHQYNTVIEKTSETCTNDGYIIKQCICGETSKEIIEKKHLYSPATCTEPSKCTRCGKIGSNAVGHSKDRAFCLRCGEKLFEKQSFSGKGPGNISNINLPAGIFNIVFSHQGSNNFICYFNNDLAVNEIGVASYIYRFENNWQTNNNYINITNADGYWTVKIDAIE